VRALIKALKKGQRVGMLPDQAPKDGRGCLAQFLRPPAYTMTLAARLTETGADDAALPGASGCPAGVVIACISAATRRRLAGSTVERAQQINNEIEALIRECPSQYLWGYNRYKRPGGAEPPPVE
jgi:KDO2-lipid IV(A) lauroyltransferase